MSFSLKETTRLPDKTTISTLHWKLPSTSCVQHITTDAWIHPGHWFISAQFLKYVPGAFLCSICDAEQKKNVAIHAAKLCKCKLQLFDSFWCQLLLELQECKEVQKKKIDWEYDAECHFNTTQQAKQSERSIREIIENRWSIWPTGRLKQASLKVKNFEQVRARHAQSKRWVKASKHPSLWAENRFFSEKSTYLAGVSSTDLKFKCVKCCQRAAQPREAASRAWWALIRRRKDVRSCVALRSPPTCCLQDPRLSRC